MQPEEVPRGQVPTSSSLRHLPPEVRLLIYAYCLVINGQPIEEPHRYTKAVSSQYPCLPGINSAILQTCRFLYDEASPILYGQNMFLFNSPYSLIRFQMRADPACFSEIKHLSIVVAPEKTQKWIDHMLGKGKSLMKDLERLQDVTIALKGLELEYGGYGCYGRIGEDLMTFIKTIAESVPKTTLQGICVPENNELDVKLPKVRLETGTGRLPGSSCTGFWYGPFMCKD